MMKLEVESMAGRYSFIKIFEEESESKEVLFQGTIFGGCDDGQLVSMKKPIDITCILRAYILIEEKFPKTKWSLDFSA